MGGLSSRPMLIKPSVETVQIDEFGMCGDAFLCCKKHGLSGIPTMPIPGVPFERITLTIDEAQMVKGPNLCCQGSETSASANCMEPEGFLEVPSVGHELKEVNYKCLDQPDNMESDNSDVEDRQDVVDFRENVTGSHKSPSSPRSPKSLKKKKPNARPSYKRRSSSPVAYVS